MGKSGRLEPESIVVSHARVLGGSPTFRGTRVQVETLFENLAEGYSLDILAEFPTLDREDLRNAILQAGEALKRTAPDITQEGQQSASRARAS